MSLASPEWSTLSPTMPTPINIERKYSELRGRCRRVERERDEQMERIEELEKEVDECNRKMDTLQKQLATSRLRAERLDTVEEEHVRVSDERDALAHELQRAKAELDEQKSKYYKMKRDYEEVSALLCKLDEENETLRSKCSELKRQLSDQLEYADYDKKKADDYEKKLTTTKESLELAIYQQNLKHTAERHDLRQRILELENELQSRSRLVEEAQFNYRERIAELEGTMQDKEEQFYIQQIMAATGRRAPPLGMARSPAGEVTARDHSTFSTFDNSAGLSLDRTSSISSSASLTATVHSESSDSGCRAGAGGSPPPPYDYGYDDDDSCLKYIHRHREQWRAQFAVAGKPSSSPLASVVLDIEDAGGEIVSGMSSSCFVVDAPVHPVSGWRTGGRWTSLVTGGGVVAFLLVSVGVATVWTLRSHMRAAQIHRD